MKGRARPPSSPESEESWTVDCPCGVNYDDGEEMVDCDECGVWVHTGCCHILKGHTSYVCDRCKFKKKKESEESEVAQLLVELPSKTPPLEEKVFTLRSELSREERAHVQGIPGGDPSFFVGVSPVFSRQLWKYTGFVPKVFQFNYNDLPQEKERACVLFAEYAETKTESISFENTKVEHNVEYGKLVTTELLPLGEANVEKYYLSKEKQSKRESRKETKNRLKEHQEDYLKGPYHSKRRRDENCKRDFTSKRRSKSFGAGSCEGTPRRSYDDATVPLKSARIASRNSRAYSSYNSVEDAVAYSGTLCNSNTRTGDLATFGFATRNATVLVDTSARKQLATKVARKVVPGSCGRSDQEGYNGSRRSLNIDSYQEIPSSRKEQDAAIRNKSPGSKTDADTPKPKDHIGSTAQTEVKVGSRASPHTTVLDVKETSPGTILNLSRTKEQLDETSPEQCASIDKVGKQLCSDDGINMTARQQFLSQKQAELNLVATVSDDDDRPLSNRITYESHAAVSPYILANEAAYQPLDDDFVRALCQEPGLSRALSPARAVPLQDVDGMHLSNQVSMGALQTLQASEENLKSSPISTHTCPSLSADLCSPTLSCPGSDSRPLDPLKIDSLSPPSERTQNLGTPQPNLCSKFVTMGSLPISSNKASSPVASKAGNNLTSVHNNGCAASKPRSKSFDMKRTDFMSEDLNGESISFSLHKDAKELSKVVGSGKSPMSGATAPQKGSKQGGNVDSGAHMNACDQNLSQSRHTTKSITTSLHHKAGVVSGSRTTTVLLSPGHASAVDGHTHGVDSMRPAMNDEEFALLLHQELNSSPRVSRVARVRHGAVGAHPFSTKRFAMASSPVASTSTPRDSHLIFRGKTKEESQGESARTADEYEISGMSSKQGTGILVQKKSKKDIETPNVCKELPSVMATEVVRHLSPGLGVVLDCQLHSDSLVATDVDDGEKRSFAENVLTLPGLIEDILNEKGVHASYDLICEEVLPHWSKLRKHNGERYAYTSHRQAVLDCLRNRSAWSHLIDRGPKTNLGRKRRRLESGLASELEYTEQDYHSHDGGDDQISMDTAENWPLVDSNKEADVSLPDEVPKGKRKARRGRRLTPQSGGPGASNHGRTESAQGMDDDFDHAFSPLSDDPVSSSEDDEIFVHRGSSRHNSRHRGSSVDSEYEVAEP